MAITNCTTPNASPRRHCRVQDGRIDRGNTFQDDRYLHVKVEAILATHGAKPMFAFDRSE